MCIELRWTVATYQRLVVDVRHPRPLDQGSASLKAPSGSFELLRLWARWHSNWFWWLWPIGIVVACAPNSNGWSPPMGVLWRMWGILEFWIKGMHPWGNPLGVLICLGCGCISVVIVLVDVANRKSVCMCIKFLSMIAAYGHLMADMRGILELWRSSKCIARGTL